MQGIHILSPPVLATISSWSYFHIILMALCIYSSRATSSDKINLLMKLVKALINICSAQCKHSRFLMRHWRASSWTWHIPTCHSAALSKVSHLRCNCVDKWHRMLVPIATKPVNSFGVGCIRCPRLLTVFIALFPKVTACNIAKVAVLFDY